ncbi:MAG: U32 family peptidase [Candidatus Gastranaerophilales bacterium]|nr:U32 family peptidase [Candidatus Gastranaerophilales bacterium]
MIKNDARYELLAPAKDKETAIAAINAGADAVYIGYSKFGARVKAGNSLEDIKSVVEYADTYRVKVYVTLNTIYNDDELAEVVKVLHKLYEIGVSAVIVQDMGLLECDLPPIKLFASTQCHNNTLEKVRFLEQTGFERVILPREFSLDEIKNITQNTDIDIETFVHGALCVSYSGQCYLSASIGGRSANRGECAQPCRKKYTLLSSDGQIIAKDKYLLSLKDLNLSDRIEDLILSGVTSFKIEGRLKDKNYVTNVVSYYRKKIDEVLEKYNLQKASVGISKINFEPEPQKSFNRGFTEFNLDGKRKNFCTKNYVKSLGEYIGKVEKVFDKYFIIKGQTLNNGDGICFFDTKTDELTGTIIQKNQDGKIFPQNMNGIKPKLDIYRNSDIAFEKELSKPVNRYIKISAFAEISDSKITLKYRDEENNLAEVFENGAFQKAENADKAIETIKRQLAKTGDTEFLTEKVEIRQDNPYFVPVSVLNNLRRTAVQKLSEIRRQNLPRDIRKKNIKIVPYPCNTVNYSANIMNEKARLFYEKRNTKVFETAFEQNPSAQNTALMTTKHCIKYTLGLCQKYFKPEKTYKEPLILRDERYKEYILEFDCKECQMRIKSSRKA